jgi:uridine phosphorylase
VRSADGRVYHLGLAPGELAPIVLLCGDPARAQRVAARFESVRCRRRHREFVTFTGRHAGIPVSVLGTGIGPDNTEIAVVELAQLVRAPTLLRLGTCGALQPRLRLGHLVISCGAVRLENTSGFFVHEGYPALAHHEALLALIEGCAATGARWHVGITASAPGFYGAQGRRVPGFPPRRPELPAELARQNVANFEMETSALFTLASLRGLRAGAVCVVFAERGRNRFIDPKAQRAAEDRLIAAGLRAVQALHRIDRDKAARKIRTWYPES